MQIKKSELFKVSPVVVIPENNYRRRLRGLEGTRRRRPCRHDRIRYLSYSFDAGIFTEACTNAIRKLNNS
jgi:hypothetical protein